MQLSDTAGLIEALEENIATLEKVFRNNINDYFYTEKELHSYFYHLALASGLFGHNDHYLIHTEYPSPFKFSFQSTAPYVVQEASKSKAQRGHIDCVLINPRFVSWLLGRGNGIKALTGIGAQRFDLYIEPFYRTYAQFNRETGEPILLYALEFKFLRHTYAGKKYPAIGIHQDLAKLRLLRGFQTGLYCEVNFVARTKAVVFVGERTRQAGKSIRHELSTYDPEEYTMIVREQP